MKKHYPLLALLTITALVGLITSHAGAAERKPTRADYQNLEDIKKNQICLNDNRPAYTRISNSFRNKEKVEPKDIPSYNRFLDCKTWNALEVSELNKNGWNVRWDTMELVDAQKEPVKKASKAPQSVAKVSKPSSTVWKWKDAPEYKNDVLRAYQEKLQARGIKDTKILVAQLIQENGALSPEVLGDPLTVCVKKEKGECVKYGVRYRSFGIIQYNSHAKHGIFADDFLAQNPEWKTIDKQLEWMADSVAWRATKYPTTKQVVVSHNCPVCAKHAVDSKAGYYTAVSKRLSLLY
jgi:hypothetical protein